MRIRFLCVLFQTLDRERVNRCEASFARIKEYLLTIGMKFIPCMHRGHHWRELSGRIDVDNAL